MGEEALAFFRSLGFRFGGVLDIRLVEGWQAEQVATLLGAASLEDSAARYASRLTGVVGELVGRYLDGSGLRNQFGVVLVSDAVFGKRPGLLRGEAKCWELVEKLVEFRLDSLKASHRSSCKCVCLNGLTARCAGGGWAGPKFHLLTQRNPLFLHVDAFSRAFFFVLKKPTSSNSNGLIPVAFHDPFSGNGLVW
jgi:hypothetical protein